MAVQAGDKIQRSTLVTLYNNMIEEAFANRLGVGSIGSHFASAWMVNAHKPLAEEINRLYAVSYTHLEGWPVLGPGGSRISWSGGVSQVVVQPNWRWL